MINFIKKYLFIILIFTITLSIGFITFLTFIDKSFISLTQENLQYLLIANTVLLFFFFLITFIEIKNSLKNDMNVRGSITNRKYIAFFSLFTLIPSVLISIFSLFMFSFALEKYFDNKITTAVNNSYEIAKNYVQEAKNKIESDIILVSYDLRNNVNTFYDNPDKFKNILRTQRIVRGIDEIHLIDSLGNKILSSSNNNNPYSSPEEKALEMVLNDSSGRPLKIINTYENKSAALIKLNGYIDTYLYVIKFLDQEISNYLLESEEAINFYYTVEDKRTGIRISFALIYVIVVTLLLFLSILIAIKFSSRFFRAINNLILASANIGKGVLETKVPEIKTDIEIETLNKNFNLMIDQLRTQQEKLLINERHEAWSSIARKLAHEIKNPLTPIQLTIDRLKTRYSEDFKSSDKGNFTEYLKIINKQIKLIENLVNEFSDFARMPKPVLKENDILSILNDNIRLLKELDNSIDINLKSNAKTIVFISDSQQISRVFFNLIKNSIESIQEKHLEKADFPKKIDIEIINKNDYIEFIIVDNGKGFGNLTDNLKDILNPYFTTKKKGSGLGLSIVNKIINEHNGNINFISIPNGAKIIIKFIKNVD